MYRVLGVENQVARHRECRIRDRESPDRGKRRLALTGHRVSGIRESSIQPFTSRSHEVRSSDCERKIQ
jgi:hypothetical protein